MTVYPVRKIRRRILTNVDVLWLKRGGTSLTKVECDRMKKDPIKRNLRLFLAFKNTLKTELLYLYALMKNAASQDVRCVIRESRLTTSTLLLHWDAFRRELVSSRDTVRALQFVSDQGRNIILPPLDLSSSREWERISLARMMRI